jgi:ZIP family zinc transporter
VNPTITVLLYSSIAAVAAALGAIPLGWRERIPIAWIGWANALAAGMMLGTAYVIVVAGLNRMVLAGASGAFMGIAFIYWTHSIARPADLDLNKLDQTGPEYGYQVLLIQSLHSASEGVAIGVAMSLNVGLGIFAAVAFAAHNVPEGTVLCAVLRARGIRLRDAAGLAVMTNVSLILMAIVTFALISAIPSLLPWALGFAMGALVYLVMSEPLPESYRQAGNTSIALVTSVAMGIVVLLNGFLV